MDAIRQGQPPAGTCCSRDPSSPQITKSSGRPRRRREQRRFLGYCSGESASRRTTWRSGKSHMTPSAHFVSKLQRRQCISSPTALSPPWSGQERRLRWGLQTMTFNCTTGGACGSDSEGRPPHCRRPTDPPGGSCACWSPGASRRNTTQGFSMP